MEKRFIVKIKKSGQKPDKKQLGILAKRLLDATNAEQKPNVTPFIGGVDGAKL